MTIWNLRQISDPEAKEAALRYLYQEVMYSPLRCTYRRFKKKLLQSVPGRLPQYYVFEKEGRYMGYFLMIAEEEEKTPRLFPWLACHNGAVEFYGKGDEAIWCDQHLEMLGGAVQAVVENLKKRRVFYDEKVNFCDLGYCMLLIDEYYLFCSGISRQ